MYVRGLETPQVLIYQRIFIIHNNCNNKLLFIFLQIFETAYRSRMKLSYLHVVSVPRSVLLLQYRHRHDNPQRPQGSRSVGPTHQDIHPPLTAVLDRPSTSDSLVDRMWPLTRPTTSWNPPNFRIVLYLIKDGWSIHILNLINLTLSLSVRM